jgi:hypothetical protein
MAHRLAAALLLAPAMACGDDDDGAGDPDASGIEGGDGGPRIEIGSGGVGRWEDLPEGSVALLARGCQGSQHVWLSLRAWGLDTSPALVQASVLFDRPDCLGELPADSCRPSVPLQIRVTFDTEADRDFTELTGIALQIADPGPVEHQACVIRARVTENTRGGASVEAEKHVTVEWGDEVCGMTLGDGAVPRLDDGGDVDGSDGGVAMDGEASGDDAGGDGDAG